MKVLNRYMLCVIILLPLSTMAQKKIIVQAQQIIKSGKDLNKAEKLMTDLLKDTSNTYNEKIYLTLFEAVKKQYEIGNEKLYLKQTYDTTALFNSVMRMFDVMEDLDSIERKKPLAVKHATGWRERNVPILHNFRRNLLYGGRFFVTKKQYEHAYGFYTRYLYCATHPLFEQYEYNSTDSLLARAAYGAMYCAYKLKRSDDVLKLSPQAEQNAKTTDYVYQFVAEAYSDLQDSDNYFKTLIKGFNHNPQFPYFFPRIVDYYIDQGREQEAMLFVDNALRMDNTNSTYRFARSTLLLNTGRYEECIEICEDLIAENDSFVDAYYNIGLAYFNSAISLDNEFQRDRKVKDTIASLYRQSLPFMERVRDEQPEQQQRWIHILYTIYLNLNMGAEFDEINRLMEQQSK